MFFCFNKEFYFCIKLKVLESLLINSIYSIKPTVWNVCAKPLVIQWQHTEQNTQIDSRTYKSKESVAALCFLSLVKNRTMTPKNTKDRKEKKKGP